MAKPKTLIKQSKKKKKEQVLEDADDYLAAGVEHEEAAGKWRAGDAAKSLRFFYRAIEVYQQGLSKYPRSLDLAYNKARVELEIATHPILRRQLDVPVRKVLEQALASHRYALEIDPDNPDTLFNTSQVLVTVAEELARDDDRFNDTLKLLEEALELQARCSGIQEFRHEENQQQQQAMLAAQESASGEEPISSASPDSSSSPSTSTAAAEDQWFSVIEPITVETLIETILAQLSTLTTLTSILANTSSLPPSPTLPWISTFSEALTSKIDTLTTATAASATNTQLSEIQLTKINLTTAILEASFRHSLIDLPTYKSQLSTAFPTPPTIPPTYPLLLAQSSALLAFASALADLSSFSHDDNTNTMTSSSSAAASSTVAADRYQALTNASTALTQASKLPDASSDEQARTHLLRGDASLLLQALGREPTLYGPAIKNAALFLGNAEVFYRNAARLFLSSSSSSPFPVSVSATETGSGVSEEDSEQHAAAVAAFRCTVAQVLQGKKADLGELGVKVGVGAWSRDWVRDQIGEMVEEGMVPEGVGAALGV